MNQAIAAFPNTAFYGGQLEHGERNADWQAGGFPPLEGYHIEGEEEETPGHSLYNHAEAKAVARQVSSALHAGINAKDIGVITPYSGQVGIIRQQLRDLDDDAVWNDVKVSTVDSFQGSERDVIIISFVRSNPQGFSGFLTFSEEGPRRLNVALTRARKRCVLIGNFETLATVAPTRTPETSAANVYRDLYQHLESEGVLSTMDQ